MSKITHVGDLSTPLDITCRDNNGAVVDISGATSKALVLVRPDGTTVSLTGVFVTDGEDGVLRGTTGGVTSDWTAQGPYRAYPDLEGVGTWDGTGTPLVIECRAVGY